MSTVIIFIPAWVLRKSVLDWAACLRTDDHLVHVRDLFDGAVFDDPKAGAAACNAIGIPALFERAQEAVSALSSDSFYLGFPRAPHLRRFWQRSLRKLGGPSFCTAH